MKAHLLALLTLGIGVLGTIACTSDGDDDNDGTFIPDTDGGTFDAPTGDPPAGNPSGALVRVFNAYAPLNEEAPGPVDLYPDPIALEGATPKLSVPYGTMSELFDPTVKGDNGDMFLSMYWPGTSGTGNALMSKTETLKGGEVITYFLAPGGSPQESGRRFGTIQAHFHQPSEGFTTPSIPEGKGLLNVSTIGLEQVLDPETHNLFFSIGAGCAKAIGDSEFTTSGVGPGSGATYALDPGSYTGTVYNDSDCVANPVVENVAFTVNAGERNVFFVYGPAENDIRTVVVALEPKQAP